MEIYSKSDRLFVLVGTKAALHVSKRTHSRAAHPRALDQTEFGGCGHHHQHHGVYPETPRRSHGQSQMLTCPIHHQTFICRICQHQLRCKIMLIY